MVFIMMPIGMSMIGKKFSIVSRLLSGIFIYMLSHSGLAAEGDVRSISLNHAILSTLSDNPGVQVVEANLERAKAQLQQGTGLFDWNLLASTSYGRTNSLDKPSIANPVIGFDDSIEISNNIAFKKLFRNGVAVQPDLTVIRSKQYEFFDPLGTSNAEITMTIPLLKGSGKGAPGINEESLTYNLKAEQYTRIYDISNLIFNTVVAYWSTFSAQQSQIIVNEGLSRGERNAEILRALVDGGELPSSQLQRAIAEIGLSQLSAESRSESLYARYQQLVGLMGEDATSTQSIPSLSTTLPDPLSNIYHDFPTYEEMLLVSFKNRGDIIAAQHLIEANSLLRDQAEKNLSPKLDLAMGVGLIGANARETGLTPLNFISHEKSKADVVVGLSFELPFDNNIAKGKLANSRALYRVAQENLKLLQIDVQSDLSAVLNRINSNRKRYKKADEAINIYAGLVKENLAGVIRGSVKFSDLVDLEDRLTRAQLTGLDARTQFALALAELRIITGTTAQIEAGKQSLLFSPEVFKSLPTVY
jgi:outer membrane protein